MIECFSDFTDDYQDFTATCDSCEEAQIEHSTGGGFRRMVEYIKEQGWQVKCVSGEWLHFCPDCKIDFNKFSGRPT